MGLSVPSLGLPAILRRSPGAPPSDADPSGPQPKASAGKVSRSSCGDQDDASFAVVAASPDTHADHHIAASVSSQTSPSSPTVSHCDMGPAHGLLVSHSNPSLSSVEPAPGPLPQKNVQSQAGPVRRDSGSSEGAASQRALTTRGSTAVALSRMPLPVAYVATTAVLSRFTTGSS